MSKVGTRWDYCPKAIRDIIGNRPRTHQNMRQASEVIYGEGRGVARPGKTAHEHARRAGRPKPVPVHQQKK